MKTKIAIAILSLTAALGSAQEASPVAPMAAPKLKEQAAKRASFGYVRLGVSDSDAIHQFETQPGVGLGFRLATGNGAVDFSGNYTREIKSGNAEHFTYTAPKISYLHYLNAAASQTPYAGLGLAWGAIRKADQPNFDGLIPSATIGYEMNRHQSVRTFAQLDVSQPAAAITSSSVSFDNLPKLAAEFSFGLGY